MKKYFLKGKAFIHQKMEQLDIQHTKLNLVAEQIPKKYHQTFKILETDDLDLQSFQKYSLYYRTYPNHPIGPLLQQKIKHEKQVMQPPYSEQIKPQKNKISMLDDDLEEKAYKLRNIVEGYSQGLPQQIDGLFGVGVVQFHHKRGAEIEFAYPDTEEVKIIFNSVIPFAMPDSSHNKMQDCSFFNLPFEIRGQKKMVYGVSYFKQVKVTEQMKLQNSELTRSHLQKSVCLLSFVPLFGQFRSKIIEATNSYFLNLNCFTPIISMYDSLSLNIKQNWKDLSFSELNIGTDSMGLLTKFKFGIFKIFKSILFNKRVIFYSQSSEVSGSAILSALSLFPGQLIFSMRSLTFDKYLEGLREYALPLKLFSSEQPLLLSTNIQIMGMLKSLQGGFVIGTSNQMLIQSLEHDILIDLDKNILRFSKQEQQEEAQTKDQKVFLAVLQKVLNNPKQFEQSFLKDHFHNYLKKSLSKIADIRCRYNTFVSLCRSFQQTMMYARKNPKSQNSHKSYSTFDEEIKQQHQLALKVPEFDQALLDIPLLPLIHKAHFRYFLQFSSPLIYLMTNKHYYDDFLLIDNFEYYFGDMPRSKTKYVTYNWKSKKLRICNLQVNQKMKMKQIKFQENGEVIQVFMGDCDGALYNGHGTLLTPQNTYEGAFRSGMKDGFGKLSSQSQTYIGTFSQGLFHGDGHLIVNQVNTVYVGMFREGLKDGFGKLQTDVFYYEGQFSEDLMSGNGSLTILGSGIKYFGSFQKNKLRQGEEQSVITFPNGDVYTGTTADMQAHGRGILHKSTGQIQEGVFVRGQYKKQ